VSGDDPDGDDPEKQKMLATTGPTYGSSITLFFRESPTPWKICLYVNIYM